jgi:hypothetical protein
MFFTLTATRGLMPLPQLPSIFNPSFPNLVKYIYLIYVFKVNYCCRQNNFIFYKSIFKASCHTAKIERHWFFQNRLKLEIRNVTQTREQTHYDVQILKIFPIFTLALQKCRGTRWCSWSRHCATSRKVAGSILDGVTGIFQWLNPSDRTVALGSTQPITEMSTRNPSWG